MTAAVTILLLLSIFALPLSLLILPLLLLFESLVWRAQEPSGRTHRLSPFWLLTAVLSTAGPKAFGCWHFPLALRLARALGPKLVIM